LLKKIKTFKINQPQKTGQFFYDSSFVVQIIDPFLYLLHGSISRGNKIQLVKREYRNQSILFAFNDQRLAFPQIIKFGKFEFIIGSKDPQIDKRSFK